MADIYKMKHSEAVQEVLEAMRNKIASGEGLGITLVGNRVTIRFNLQKQLVNVHLIISTVTTVREADIRSCGHPVHGNVGLLIDCPECGATPDERMNLG